MNVSLQDTFLPARLSLRHPMSDDELFDFCQLNEILQVERDTNGDLSLMSPGGLEGDVLNTDIITELTLWAREDGRGKSFGSNAGFTLSNGSMRGPDAAWFSRERWQALPRREQTRFGHVVPEFIIELRSKGDGLAELREKMAMWICNGVDVAWLVDPRCKVIGVKLLVQGTDINYGFPANTDRLHALLSA